MSETAEHIETPLRKLFDVCDSGQAPDYTPESRSIRLHGHSTTIRLERAFWEVLEKLAGEEGITIPELITRISQHCLNSQQKNLASCLRVLCLVYISKSFGG